MLLLAVIMIDHEYSELTASEKYLTHQCKHTFLNMWAWPHVYRHQKWNGGPGKEVCDLLVVFGSHVIIFSDKYCEFPDTGDLILDWCRWFKKAIVKSAEQIWGAERWIRQHPDKLYVDKECITKFPIPLPEENKITFHRIVIAHGFSQRCKEYMGGRGGLALDSSIVGTAHYDNNKHDIHPFRVGVLSDSKGFVHVLGDHVLDIVLNNVDTITDFVDYLEKKVHFYESDAFGFAYGEEDLIADYLGHVNENEEHDFRYPKTGKKAFYDVDLWEKFQRHPDRAVKIDADTVSYAWDKLIDKFTKHILGGTLHYTSSTGEISEHEKGLRFLARENRVSRRLLSKSLLAIMERANKQGRSARFLASYTEGSTYYVFLALETRDDLPDEKYRIARFNLLYAYCRTVKVICPSAINIIGIATEPMNCKQRSEDLAYLNASDWTDEFQKEAEKEREELGLFKEIRKTDYSEDEYPREQFADYHKGRNRNKPCPCASGKKYKKCCGKKS